MAVVSLHGGTFSHLSQGDVHICVTNHASVDEESEEVPETVKAYRRVVISYDVGRRRHSVAVRVGEYVFGRKVRVQTKNGMKTYRYPGLLSRRAAERLGQSVLILTEKDAEDFHKFLTELRVSHTWRTVWAEF